MEEGTKTKKTVFVGGLSDDVDEAVIYENFSTFGTPRSIIPIPSLPTQHLTGDIMEVQLPSAVMNPHQPAGQ